MRFVVLLIFVLTCFSPPTVLAQRKRNSAVSKGDARKLEKTFFGSTLGTLRDVVGNFIRCGDSPTPAPTPTPTHAPTPTPAPQPQPQPGYQIGLQFLDATDEEMTLVKLATARFSEIITGDLPEASYTGTSTACGPDLDMAVDDMNICYRFRDLPSPIVAVGGPRLVRTNDGFENIPFTGEISVDPSLLMDPKRFIPVVEQQTLATIGLGTLWDNQGLVTQGDGICTYDSTKEASTQFRAIAGCTDETLGVPMEPDCLHWSSACFNDVEVLTPFGGFILSRITVAALKDFGYSVDLDQADTLLPELLSPDCCTPPVTLGSSSMGISEEAKAFAIEYGLQLLAGQVSDSGDSTTSEGVMDVSGMVVAVTVLENDLLYKVIVSSKDAV